MSTDVLVCCNKFNAQTCWCKDHHPADVWPGGRCFLLQANCYLPLNDYCRYIQQCIAGRRLQQVASGVFRAGGLGGHPCKRLVLQCLTVGQAKPNMPPILSISTALWFAHDPVAQNGVRNRAVVLATIPPSHHMVHAGGQQQPLRQPHRQHRCVCVPACMWLLISCDGMLLTFGCVPDHAAW